MAVRPEVKSYGLTPDMPVAVRPEVKSYGLTPDMPLMTPDMPLTVA